MAVAAEQHGPRLSSTLRPTSPHPTSPSALESARGWGLQSASGSARGMVLQSGSRSGKAWTLRSASVRRSVLRSRSASGKPWTSESGSARPRRRHRPEARYSRQSAVRPRRRVDTERGSHGLDGRESDKHHSPADRYWRAAFDRTFGTRSPRCRFSPVSPAILLFPGYARSVGFRYRTAIVVELCTKLGVNCRRGPRARSATRRDARPVHRAGPARIGAPLRDGVGGPVAGAAVDCHIERAGALAYRNPGWPLGATARSGSGASARGGSSPGSVNLMSRRFCPSHS